MSAVRDGQDADPQDSSRIIYRFRQSVSSSTSFLSFAISNSRSVPLFFSPAPPFSFTVFNSQSVLLFLLMTSPLSNRCQCHPTLSPSWLALWRAGISLFMFAHMCVCMYTLLSCPLIGQQGDRPSLQSLVREGVCGQGSV